MGWEWRLFFHGDLREPFVAFAQQTFTKMSATGPPEDRTDVYVSCSDSVGAKARGGGSADGQIEIKTRTDRKKRGAEMWKKERVPRPSVAASRPDAPGDVLKDTKLVLKPSEWDEKSAMEVIAFKSRTQFKLHEDRFKGIHLECTLVRVDPECKVFTSVCLEHKKDATVIYDVVEAMNLEAFHPEQRIASCFADGAEGMGGSVVGYPEFAMFVARGRLATPPPPAPPSSGPEGP